MVETPNYYFWRVGSDEVRGGIRNITGWQIDRKDGSDWDLSTAEVVVDAVDEYALYHRFVTLENE